MTDHKGTFENDVKMYGTQAALNDVEVVMPFENDVKMYGTQAVCGKCGSNYQFENDVKMYGTQANRSTDKLSCRLRMM